MGKYPPVIASLSACRYASI